MDSDKWECSLCHYHNRANDMFCEMCESPQNSSNQNEHMEQQLPHIADINPIKRLYVNQTEQSQNNGIQGIDEDKNAEIDENEWKCPVCTFINNISLPYCEVCFYEKNDTNQSDQYIEHDILVDKEEKHDIPINDNITGNKLQSNENIDNIDDEKATLLLIEQLQQEDVERQLMVKHDIEAAKELEEKYEKDEVGIKADYEFALKIQKELAKDTIAWFCGNCFTMNIDPTSNICSKCDKAKPKPKISVMSIPTFKNKISMQIIEIARKYKNNNSCIINIKHALAFVTKYYEMSKRLGPNKCRPQICYHWTRTQNFEAIKKQSLKVPDGKKLKHQTDVGYYGKGIYTSNDPNFAKAYGHGAKKLFVCLSLNGKMYPAKYPQDKGIGLKAGYDSHKSGDNKDGDIGKQWIFFDTAQLLLMYLVTLDEMQFVLPILKEISAYIQSKYKQLRKGVPNAKGNDE